MYFILSLLLIGVGVSMIIFPRIWFEFAEGWKHNSASEPSALYIFSIRFGGVMCALTGIAYIVVYLFL